MQRLCYSTYYDSWEIHRRRGFFILISTKDAIKFHFKAYGIYTFNVVPTYIQNFVPTYIQNVVPTFIPNAVLIHKFLYWLNIIHQCWEYQILLENLVLVYNAQPAFRTQYWANISCKYWYNATFPILLEWREFNFVPMLTWNIDQASKPWSLHKVFD